MTRLDYAIQAKTAQVRHNEDRCFSVPGGPKFLQQRGRTATMRWRRGSHRAGTLRPAPDPIVLPVDHVLTRVAAADLTGLVDRLPTDARVVIDLTGIAGFDTDGATDLLNLQDRVGHDRLTIVGFRQAA